MYINIKESIYFINEGSLLSLLISLVISLSLEILHFNSRKCYGFSFFIKLNGNFYIP